MEIEQATVLSLTNPDEAINALSQIISRDNKESPNDDEIKLKEHAIFQLASILSKEGRAQELAKLIRYVRPFLSNVSKAKAAKIVQTLLDKFLEINALSGLEIELCKECIDWAKEENRIFLRQALEAKLLALYYETKHYDEALLLSTKLLKELKKMDDKNLLVEVQLLESKVYHALGNLPKARASLTSARTTANSIYCPPKMQAALDLQSGIGHAAEEKDFKTAYSYLYEAFEGYESIENRPKVILALKYMLLCKIMLNCPEEVESMVSGKLALKYPGRDIEAMRALAVASRKRSLADFQKAIEQYGKELMNDATITTLLHTLYDKLLEQNLLRIIEPYSKVQIVYISTVMELPLPTVEKKLSQMILDKKFLGIIDQGEGVLIVFDERTKDDTFETAVNIIECMSKVVDTLYVKAKKLS